jgi:hypothetical protein
LGLGVGEALPHGAGGRAAGSRVDGSVGSAAREAGRPAGGRVGMGVTNHAEKRSGAIEKLRAGLWKAAVRRFQLKWVQFSFDFLSSFLSGGTQM